MIIVVVLSAGIEAHTCTPFLLSPSSSATASRLRLLLRSFVTSSLLSCSKTLLLSRSRASRISPAPDTRVENETGGDSESRSNSTACCIGIKAARLSLEPSDSSFCSFMICQGSRLLCRIGDESCDWESSPGVSEKSVASIQKTSALRRDSFSRLPAMLCAHASFVSMV